MFKIKSKFFRSLNFRIMVSLCLFGCIPALAISGAFLVSYEKQSLTQLGNDVRNQCQIVATQLGNGDYLANPDKNALKAELSQLATLYDGRIIIIDENFQIVEDTSELEIGLTSQLARRIASASTLQQITASHISMED